MEPFVCRPSYAQDRLWLLHRMSPDDPAYHLAWAFRLTGPLDVTALATAFTAVAARHEVLRATFRDEAGRPAQVIAPTWDCRLPVEDLTGHEPAVRDAVLRRRMRDAAWKPFDLERGPLLRPVVFRLADDEHVLLIGAHHIVFDGGSVPILQTDLARAYAHASEGGTLPELPLQYADFAAWQRSPAQRVDQERQLDHWRDHLADAPAPLRPPTDRPRDADTAPLAGRYEFPLPRAVVDGVRAMARAESATPFMPLLAAFATLLGRYTRRDDLVIGVPVAGRDRPELADTIGLFVNTLPLRIGLVADLTFRHLLGQVREVCLGGFENADVPFERLVEEIRPHRDADGQPFFRAMCVMHPAEQPVLRLPGLATLREPVDPLPAPAELVLSFIPEDGNGGRGGGIRARLDYAAELFDEARVVRMAGHLRTLLAAGCARPDAPLSTLPLLTDAEHAQVVHEWNRAEPSDADACLHELVAGWAARTPDARAVTDGMRSLTYGELTWRADLVAHRLRRLGVGPDVIVGVCLERSVDLVVALLGVLRAGGAYLPLDPAYPPERLALLLEDSGAGVVVTEEGVRGVVPGAGYELVFLDGDVDGDRAVNADADVAVAVDRPAATPDHLAYVIHTSGSTGRPNGVLVTHANVVRLLRSTAAWFGFGPDDVWTLFHSFAFDFSVWELWGALAHGGRVVVVSRDAAREPDVLLDILRRERVTVLNQTPTALLQLDRADEAAGRPPLALRQVILGGEKCDPGTLRNWMERRGHTRPRLSNMYGITETTVHVTHHPLKPADLAAGTGSPIGVRIPDLRTYVLDEAMLPVPEGIPGELYVGGPGVARGYLGRPELTRARFLPDPYTDRPGARLYRTGDLVRWLAGGRLEFIGRVDDQVTIRGHRVEPGEVEAALRAHPGVLAAAVVPREDPTGGHVLVAYVVPARDGVAPDPAELRGFLGGRLPAHMLPGHFVTRERLPLTPNGKLDRAALPAPDTAAVASRDSLDAAPGTPVETALVRIWAEVLALDKVGVHDDFLDLGGHSLLAVRIVNRVRDELGFPLTVRKLFEHPTVAGIGRLIDGET
ncbi:amino acid adenylation domain-containing protein [Streptomyces sp. NPDC091292]|uniref:amino acid adenylation domain-containing protein n=1 Tax=Streptomyces sp. NPDC091292 TaxID=3365991 RepID=UPI003822E51F